MLVSDESGRVDVALDALRNAKAKGDAKKVNGHPVIHIMEPVVAGQ